MMAGRNLALHDRHLAVPRGTHRAAESTSSGHSQTHLVPRELQVEESHQSQQLADDASGFTGVSGENTTHSCANATNSCPQ